MKEKEKKPRTRSADPRSSHPAILAVKSITGKFPVKEQYHLVIAALGENPDIPRLRKNWDEWLTVSSNVTSLVWCTRWYTDPSQVPGKKKSAYQPDWNAGGTGKLVL